MSEAYIRGRAYELKVHREWANEYVLKLNTLRQAIYTELAPVRRTVIQERANVSKYIFQTNQFCASICFLQNVSICILAIAGKTDHKS